MTTSWKDMGFINGVMAKNNMKVYGITIRWMEKELWHGKMEENMKENFKMIINMGLECIIGKMVESMRVIG